MQLAPLNHASIKLPASSDVPQNWHQVDAFWHGLLCSIADHLARPAQRQYRTHADGSSYVLQMQRTAAVDTFARKVCAGEGKHSNIFIELVRQR